MDILPTATMFYSFNSRQLAYLTLILGLWISVSTANELEPENESVEGDDHGETNDNEVKQESVSEADPDSESKEEHEVSSDSDSNSDSDKEECNNPSNRTKTLCCKTDILDDKVIRCYLIHQKSAPKDNEEDPIKLIKFVSCLVECVYKSKKYIGKGEKLNMKMIESDAKKLFKHNQREQKFMIDMYKYCGQEATVQWTSLKKEPGVKGILARACKPYFTFVFICALEYSEKVSCPYYKWKDNDKSKNICNEMKKKCAKLF